jgi:hypothetical protein
MSSGNGSFEEKKRTFLAFLAFLRRSRHERFLVAFREEENIHIFGRSFQRKQHSDGFEEFPEETDIAVARRCFEKKMT